MNTTLELTEPNILAADVIDGTCCIETTTRKDNVLERINKRNKDRQNYLDVKLEQRNKENLQYEGADYFAQAFSERVRDIETRLKNITETTTKRPSSGELSKTELTRHFAEITMEIQEIQRYLTTSTIFLTDFKIKACQNILNDLTSSCEEARSVLLPKKKFGFSGGRKLVPKALAINPKLAKDKADGCNEKSSPAGGDGSSIFTWTLANRTNAYICLSGSDVDGKDITISNVHNCLIELQGHAGSVQISNATECTFLCGPIARSLFAENCRSCTFAVACQQLRLHSSMAVRIYMQVTCRAIIEDCSQVEVAPYCYDYPGIETDFEKAGLDKSQNNYTDVADFNWLSPDVHSPNWKLLKSVVDPNWSELRCSFKEKNRC